MLKRFNSLPYFWLVCDIGCCYNSVGRVIMVKFLQKMCSPSYNRNLVVLANIMLVKGFAYSRGCSDDDNVHNIREVDF